MQLNPTAGLSAVVTGGASGLGEATARALAARGVRVALFDMNAERGEAVAQDIGGLFVKTDITSDAEVDAAFAAARAAHGQERILINCAGIVTGARTVSRDRQTGALSHFPLEAFRKTLEVNLLGTYRCLAKSALGMAALPPLEDGERGVIVNTASVAAVEGQVGQAAYSASKGGVLGLTLPVARDLASEGIRVNVILPGVFMTPMMESLPQAVQESIKATVPFPPRLGVGADFAALALHIVENAYLNGESIRLDGAVRLAAR
ncbi:2-(R)-hydroxypropyl-CoM dehydrogenase [compost metagenome]